MKKTFLIILFIIGITSLSYGQAWDGIGDKKVSAGLEFYGYGSGIVANYDYGIHDDFSVGGGINFNFDSSNFYFNIRGDYHFQRLLEMPSIFDLYAGLDLGFNTNHSSSFGFGAHLGGRYMFTDVIGLFVEIGSRGSVGVIYNL
jgi:hypothetical protein